MFQINEYPYKRIQNTPLNGYEWDTGIVELDDFLNEVSTSELKNIDYDLWNKKTLTTYYPKAKSLLVLPALELGSAYVMSIGIIKRLHVNGFKLAEIESQLRDKIRVFIRVIKGGNFQIALKPEYGAFLFKEMMKRKNHPFIPDDFQFILKATTRGDKDCTHPILRKTLQEIANLDILVFNFDFASNIETLKTLEKYLGNPPEQNIAIKNYELVKKDINRLCKHIETNVHPTIQQVLNLIRDPEFNFIIGHEIEKFKTVITKLSPRERAKIYLDIYWVSDVFSSDEYLKPLISKNQKIGKHILDFGTFFSCLISAAEQTTNRRIDFTEEEAFSIIKRRYHFTSKFFTRTLARCLKSDDPEILEFLKNMPDSTGNSDHLLELYLKRCHEPTRDEKTAEAKTVYLKAREQLIDKLTSKQEFGIKLPSPVADTSNVVGRINHWTDFRGQIAGNQRELYDCIDTLLIAIRLGSNSDKDISDLKKLLCIILQNYSELKKGNGEESPRPRNWKNKSFENIFFHGHKRGTFREITIMKEEDPIRLLSWMIKELEWFSNLNKNDLRLIRDFETKLENLPNMTKPSSRWLAKINAELNEATKDILLNRLENFDPIFPMERKILFLKKEHDLIRGFIWALSTSPSKEAAQHFNDLAFKCYQTQPETGIIAEKLGNACIWALGNFPNNLGKKYLVQLKQLIQQTKLQKQIEKILS